MRIPDYVNQCISRLEAAGYPTYAVGGCVRDSLLGLIPQDYDLCTAALPEQTEAVFGDCRLVLAGKKHGTVGVVTEDGVVEITTFRTEGGYQDSRHPDWVKFVPDVTEDLTRRDFTVNAMAYSPSRGFADPFGGQLDLQKGILRAVGDPETRFREDALRILRGARFGAKYRLIPEEATLEAMETLAPLMDTLARERVFEELCKLLPVADEVSLLRFAPILAAAIPELKPMMGFDQRNPHHAYDLFTHTALVTAAVPPVLPLKWAALLHDVGKPACFSLDADGCGHFYGHAGVSAQMSETILLELKAPTALRSQVVTLVKQHMNLLEPSSKVLRRWLSRLGEETLRNLMLLQQADMGGKTVEKSERSDYFREISEILAQIQAENACLSVRDLAIDGHDLMALGYRGRALGQCLEKLLDQVLEEQLENNLEALLAAAKKDRNF